MSSNQPYLSFLHLSSLYPANNFTDVTQVFKKTVVVMLGFLRHPNLRKWVSERDSSNSTNHQKKQRTVGWGDEGTPTCIPPTSNLCVLLINNSPSYSVRNISNLNRVFCYSPKFKIAKNASWGISTPPTCFMRFFPAFCFSNSFFLREMSPP